MSVERGLPVEMAFMRANGAFATDNADELTLTPAGRYLVVVLYRQYLAGLNNLREQARSELTASSTTFCSATAPRSRAGVARRSAN